MNFQAAFGKHFFCINSPPREFCILTLDYLFSHGSHHASFPMLSNNHSELQCPQAAAVSPAPLCQSLSGYTPLPLVPPLCLVNSALSYSNFRCPESLPWLPAPGLAASSDSQRPELLPSLITVMCPREHLLQPPRTWESRLVFPSRETQGWWVLAALPPSHWFPPHDLSIHLVLQRLPNMAISGAKAPARAACPEGSNPVP